MFGYFDSLEIDPFRPSLSHVLLSPYSTDKVTEMYRVQCWR